MLPLYTRNLVQLQGATNVRDIGGWTTLGGGHIRHDALFRGDRLSNLTHGDLDELASRGIRTVVDFRGADEIERDPSRLWEGVTSLVPLPIQERNTQSMALLDQILAGQITAISEPEMADIYVELLADNAAQLACFVTIAADVDNWPMLYHCTAGKDRTGLATAIVLELCGVDRTQVLDEYCITNEQRSKKRIAELAEVFERAGIDMEAVKPLLMAPRAVLDATLTHIDDAYDGIENFLVAQGGMDPAAAEQLRINLTI